MKATVRLVETHTMPKDAIDLPPELINEWQKAAYALLTAEVKIREHLTSNAEVDLTVPW